MSTALTNRTPLGQVTSITDLLKNEHAYGQLSAVAAKHLNPERMMRVVANAIRTTPKLKDCEPLSFLGAMMQCASLGLEPNTVLGQAYLIPFDKKAKNPKTGKWEVMRTDVQLIIGYKGLIDLARRSGHITSLSANVHYSDDELWEYEEGTEAKLRHRPGSLEGKKLHAYAIAQFKDGGHAYAVLPWAHVMKIRNGSQGWQTAVKYGKQAETPWGKYEDEMAKKTAIRALAKYLPLSVEFRDAITVDDASVDYRAFAMAPDEGAMVDGEIYSEETDGPADIEAPKPEMTARDITPEREREREQEKPKAAAKEEAQQPVDMFEGRPARERKRPEDDPLARFKSLAHMVSGDLLDGEMDIDTILKGYDDRLSECKAQAPEIYASIMQEVQDYRDAAEG